MRLQVNGVEVSAEAGQLLIDACEDAGVYIPRFCYHPRMTPVGMCRMCLVEVDTGRGPSLQPACMISCTDAMVVETESPVTKKAQDGVLEFLLINHPLDCPVCDKGGECPLQDQTMSYGPGESRFVEEKRHFEKPIPISDTVYLDRERCILCDRCTRFAKEVAGDPLIHFLDRGSHTQVNTFPDDPFASYFSGNTVQICPVGALTAKPYRFRARPWDLEQADSTFPNPTGDRINVHVSRDEVLRIQGVDSDAVNWGWLADCDRFSFEAIGHPDRLSAPLVRGSGLGQPDPSGTELVAASWSHALGNAAERISAALERSGPDSIGVIGGSRLTNEDQYAWAKLAKGLLGTDNVDAQLGDGLPAEVVLGLERTTIADACAVGSVVIWLAPDPKEQFGSLYLRLRHGALHDGVTVVELTPTATGLRDVASHHLHPRPGEVALVARALVAGDATGTVAGIDASLINAAAADLADRPVTVIFGRSSLAEDSAPTCEALAALAELPGARFLPALRRGNVHGALDMGLAPGLLPGRTTLDAGRVAFGGVWPTLPNRAGLDTTGMLEAAAAGDIDVLVLVGADPLSDHPNPELATRALDSVGTVIALDRFITPSVGVADVVLAAAGFTECDGTHTNLEGRITPMRKVVNPPGTARSDWMIAAELADRLGHDLGFASVDDIWSEIQLIAPAHTGITMAAIAAELDGVVVDGSHTIAVDGATDPVETRPVDSYSYRLVVDRSMYDQGTTATHASALSASAMPAVLRLHPADFDRIGVDPGESVRVSSEAGTLLVAATADPGVPRGVAAMAANRAGADARELIESAQLVTEVRVESS